MGGIPGLDLSDPKQLADFARYDLSGSRFGDGDLHVGADDDLCHTWGHRLKHCSLILSRQLGVEWNQPILSTPELVMLLKIFQ